VSKATPGPLEQIDIDFDHSHPEGKNVSLAGGMTTPVAQLERIGQRSDNR
jgi:hypothetical protein